MIERLMALVLAAVASAAVAQETVAPLQPLPIGSVLLSTPSNHAAAPGTWEVRFEHRFNGRVADGSHSLFGMDSGANVTLCVSYVPVRDLEISLMRSNALDDFELAAKYVVVQEARAIPFTLALRAGLSNRTEENLDDRWSLFAQATVSRRIGRAEIFATPTYVTNAGIAPSGDRTGALFRNAFNVPVGAVFMIQPATALVAEWVPLNRDLPRSMRGDGGWAVGVKRLIGRHHFDVMLTNSLGTTVHQYASSSWQGSPLSRSDVHIGFNIARRFGRSR